MNKKVNFNVQFNVLGNKSKRKKISVTARTPAEVKKFCKKIFGSINAPYDVVYSKTPTKERYNTDLLWK